MSRNFALLNTWQSKLQMMGYKVVNPNELLESMDVEEVKPEHCARICIKAMMDCEVVATIGDWWDSKQSKIEVEIARQLNIPVDPVMNLKEEDSFF